MRRVIGISLILLFGLGPLSAALPAGAESRLPSCCRRQGAHHCAMNEKAAAMMAEAAPDSGSILIAPSHCPYFPGYAVATTAPVYALAAAPAGLPTLLTRPHSPASSRAAARLSQFRTRAGRGPPAATLA